MNILTDGSGGLIARALQVCAMLSRREQHILAMRYGFNWDGPRTCEGIGKELGLTRERIRQIEARALRRAVEHFRRPDLANIDRAALLALDIGALSWSVRVQNALRNAEIQTIGDLVTKTISDLFRWRNFGHTSTLEVENNLASIGLCLGMQIEEAKP